MALAGDRDTRGVSAHRRNSRGPKTIWLRRPGLSPKEAHNPLLPRIRCDFVAVEGAKSALERQLGSRATRKARRPDSPQPFHWPGCEFVPVDGAENAPERQ